MHKQADIASRNEEEPEGYEANIPDESRDMHAHQRQFTSHVSTPKNFEYERGTLAVGNEDRDGQCRQALSSWRVTKFLHGSTNMHDKYRHSVVETAITVACSRSLSSGPEIAWEDLLYRVSKFLPFYQIT